MEEIVLNASQRNIVGKQVRALRRMGQLPGIIYGKGFSPLPILLDSHQAGLVLPTLSSSQLIVINVDGQNHTSLVREKQRHPVTGHLIHVDFQEVSMTERLRAMVELDFIGESPAVKNYNGVLVANLEQLEVEALPADLPERIQVDISPLKEIGDAIHVRDILLSSEVEVLNNLEEIVIVVTAPAAEEEVEVTETTEAEPEVIERQKKEEEF
jgi:large subunit ribosomal protein L25